MTITNGEYPSITLRKNTLTVMNTTKILKTAKLLFSIPINSFEGLSFNSEETAACIFQDGKFYYVQILFRVDDAFSATDSLEEKLTKKYGTPAKYEPQYGSYRWDTSKSNITVTAISDTAVAVWFADIDSPYNPLNK